MDQELQNTDEIEIDLQELFIILWHKLGVILFSGFALALVTMAVTQVAVTPQYDSITKIVVLARQDVNTLTSGDMQTSTQLTKDYAELIKSRTVVESVIAKLDLDLKFKEMLKKIEVTTASDTRIVSIRVRDEDPYEASEIANAIRDAAADHIQKVMDTEAVNVVDAANVPDEQATPSVMRNGVIAGVLGCLLAAAVIFVLYLLNDTIKTPEDVEHYLGLSTLGNIPVSQQSAKGRKRKRHKWAGRRQTL